MTLKQDRGKTLVQTTSFYEAFMRMLFSLAIYRSDFNQHINVFFGHTGRGN